jgi:hypothetical protein
MTVRTRIERLERTLAKGETPETVVRVREVVVHSRAEVEQLRLAGLMEPSPPQSQSATRGLVRLVFTETDVNDLLGLVLATPTRDRHA